MTINALVPAIVALVAAIVYVFAPPTQPKIAELAKLLFHAAAIATMLAFAETQLHVAAVTR